MFSVDAGSITLPVSTLIGRGLHCLMRAFVASLPKTAKAWSVGGVKPSAASGCAQKRASLSSVQNMLKVDWTRFGGKQLSLSVINVSDRVPTFGRVGQWEGLDCLPENRPQSVRCEFLCVPPSPFKRPPARGTWGKRLTACKPKRRAADASSFPSSPTPHTDHRCRTYTSGPRHAHRRTKTHKQHRHSSIGTRSHPSATPPKTTPQSAGRRQGAREARGALRPSGQQPR
mmetsp:Transcript_25217/g.72582  ORF Transcript_25217/g.72582 Transcript_25217/m.72582 type:complete len:229 (+) Transcript_25217:835-1521(+)